MKPNAPWRIANVPLHDWIFAILGICAALYLGFSWKGLEIDILGFHYSLPMQSLRQGAPAAPDIFFGTILILLCLEIARRTLGPVLPIIILVFMRYSLFGPYIPVQILEHPGVNWQQFVNNMYFPQEGIFGVTLWVVSTVVFHFVLFGVMAQRMDLGQFFIDNAMILAGRYSGGPAKVGVVSSAFFGTISGSSIANTVLDRRAHHSQHEAPGLSGPFRGRG